MAALQHTDLRAMARAADAVVLESRAVDGADRLVPSVNSLSLLDSAVDGACAAPLAPVVAAVSAQRPPPKKSDGLCAAHARWGKETYKCQSPKTCKMRGVIAKRPAATASGNGGAGGH